MEVLFPSLEDNLPNYYRAKNHFDFTIGNYRLFVADNKIDVFQALQLRGRVFLDSSDKIDFDHFDLIADHILIEDLRNSQIIGTYRLISDIFSTEFYSQTEFVMDEFLQQKGFKVELGRACIHPDYRSGRAIDLLWRGIATYLQQLGARYLFGCSSLFLNEEEADASISHLYSIYSQKEYSIKSIEPYPLKTIEQIPIQSPKIPGLLQSYLNAGAKVYGEPYWDKKWSCVDFLTILDVKNLSDKFKRHYFSND